MIGTKKFQKKSDHPPSQTVGLLAPFGRSGRIFKHATILDRGTDPNHRSKTGWNRCIQLYCARQQQWRDEAVVAPYGVPSRAKLSGARF